MGLRTKFQNAVNSFKTDKDKTILGNLPGNGRSSKSEYSMNGILNGIGSLYGYINPYYPVELIEYITLLSILNPDVKQAVSNYITVANSGHQIIIEDKNTALVTKALERLNSQAATLYTRGIDGFFNDGINQVYLTGALSVESVLESNLKGVKKIVFVPTKHIRHKYDEALDGFAPYQVGPNLMALQGLKLNEITYTYYPHFLLENSPYGIPPLLAAILPAGIQKDMIENLRYLMKKVGLLGFTHVKVKKLLRKPNETEEQNQKRNQEYIDQVAKDMNQNIAQGVLVSPEEQDVAFHSIISETRGIKEIWQLNEELLFSGMQSLPAWHGRNYTSTETYAQVVWGLMIRTADNLRNIIKRAVEKTYRLDLLLNGLMPEKISIKFKSDLQLNPNTEQLARQYQVNNVLKLVKVGTIEPNKGAQELGYDKWFDEARIDSENQGNMANMSNNRNRLVFDYDRQENQYVFNRPTHRRDIAQFSQQTESEAEQARRDAILADRKLQQYIRSFLLKVLPQFNDLRSDVERYAVEYLKTHLEEISQDSSVLLAAVVEYVTVHNAYIEISKEDSWFRKESKLIIFDAGKYYKTIDLSALGGTKPAGVEFHFGEGDIAACEFYEKFNNFFFSGFLDNKDFGKNINQYIKQWITTGEGNFEKYTEEAFDTFKKLFGKAFKDDLEFQFERIIDTTISRLRTSSHFEQLYEAGFIYAIVNEVLDAASCDVCREMHGKKVMVKEVRKLIQDFVNADSMEAALEWIKKTNINSVDDAKLDMSELLKQGRGFPQYHCKCRGTVKGSFEEVGI